jgi:hypothetical protein
MTIPPNGAGKKFTAFPEPVDQDDAPILRPNGEHYQCTGCKGEIPGGMLVHTDVAVRSNKVVIIGMYAREGYDGPVTHACGTMARMYDEVNNAIEERATRQQKAARAARLAQIKAKEANG